MGSRIGQGVDVHAFGGDGPLRILGIEIEGAPGLVGTSDADVGAHAIADALLGAASLGDLGDHFPSADPRWENADSMELLEHVRTLVMQHGHSIANVDVTIILQSVRLSPYRAAMRLRLAETLDIDIEAVSVKATTTDHLGFIGEDKGAAATAVALLFVPPAELVPPDGAERPGGI